MPTWGWLVVVLLVALAAFALGALKEPLVPTLKARLDEAWKELAAVKRDLAASVGLVEETRRRLGHEWRMAQDAAGQMYLACGRCGVDRTVARYLGTNERCGGVKFSDAAWKLKVDEHREAVRGEGVAS